MYTDTHTHTHIIQKHDSKMERKKGLNTSKLLLEHFQNEQRKRKNGTKQSRTKNTFESSSHKLHLNYSLNVTKMAFGKYYSGVCVYVCVCVRTFLIQIFVNMYVEVHEKKTLWFDFKWEKNEIYPKRNKYPPV